MSERSSNILLVYTAFLFTYPYLCLLFPKQGHRMQVLTLGGGCSNFNEYSRVSNCRKICPLIVNASCREGIIIKEQVEENRSASKISVWYGHKCLTFQHYNKYIYHVSSHSYFR